MSKPHPQRRDLMREQLAHQAAKLMAESGITDHTMAKQKAARQLGAADAQHLPSNQEVDEALLSYRALYQQDSHPESLTLLREEALAVPEDSNLQGLAGGLEQQCQTQQSKRGALHISKKGRAIQLVIGDNGQGFDPSETHSGDGRTRGQGLVGMQSVSSFQGDRLH